MTTGTPPSTCVCNGQWQCGACRAVRRSTKYRERWGAVVPDDLPPLQEPVQRRSLEVKVDSCSGCDYLGDPTGTSRACQVCPDKTIMKPEYHCFCPDEVKNRIDGKTVMKEGVTCPQHTLRLKARKERHERERVADQIGGGKNGNGTLQTTGTRVLAVAAPDAVPRQDRTRAARATKSTSDFFDRVVILHLKKRRDRLARIYAELERVQWPFREPEIFYGYEGAKLPEPPGWTAGPGAAACREGHLAILRQAIQDDVQSLLVFEDDVVFEPNFVERVMDFLQRLPDDWDGMMWGGQHMVNCAEGTYPKAQEVAPGILRAMNCNRCHAYAGKLKYIKALYRQWSTLDREFWAPPMKGISGKHIDWSQVVSPIQQAHQVYCPVKWFVSQGDGCSDIGGETDKRTWDVNPHQVVPLPHPKKLGPDSTPTLTAPNDTRPQKLRAELAAEKLSPRQFPQGNGRGIVMCAGGNLYLSCAYLVVSELRRLGCMLPVELWHLGRAEMDLQASEAFSRLGVECRNAKALHIERPMRILNGWELKPLAVAHSRFEDVLFLDADCIPVVNPAFLFDTGEYARDGAIFWPDIHGGKPLNKVPWSNVGLGYRNEPDFESGQLLIKRSRCQLALAMTLVLNDNSDFVYQFVYGDKSTWHLGWRLAECGYAMPSKQAEWRWPVIHQHGFDGELLFQHVTGAKELLMAGGLTQLSNAYHVAAAVKERDVQWSGRLWDWRDMTEEELIIAKNLVGKWNYNRVDISARQIELADKGRITEGAASCELRWSVKFLDGQLNLIIVGKAFKGTEIGMMFLTSSDGTTFRGKWEAHEKGPVELQRC